MTFPVQLIKITIGLAGGGGWRRPFLPEYPLRPLRRLSRRPAGRRFFLAAASFVPLPLPGDRLPVLVVRAPPDIPPCGRELLLGARVAMMPTVGRIWPG